VIQTVPELASTNAELAAWLRAGEALPEGFWLVADRQFAGRGRQGRLWFDGLGNFMGSSVYRPLPGDPPPNSLALVAGLAVHGAVAPWLPAGRAAQLKWPNDLLLDRAKLAGVLLESCCGSVIVGIGVNLAIAPDLPERETTALAQWGGAPERDDFARTLAARFAAELAVSREEGLSRTIARWCEVAHPPGTVLSLGEPGEPAVRGCFAGLANDGALQLRLPDGTCQIVYAGEVRLFPPV